VQVRRGELYLPIFERLESEIAAARAKEATLERARQRCEAQAARPVRPAGNLQAIRGFDSEDEDQKVIGSANPDNAPPTPENVVPLKDRLSLSPADASALTGIGITSIKNATYSGALVAKKHGKNTIILPDDLRDWLGSLPTMGEKD
jgi:hypothetical protein